MNLTRETLTAVFSVSSSWPSNDHVTNQYRFLTTPILILRTATNSIHKHIFFISLIQNIILMTNDSALQFLPNCNKLWDLLSFQNKMLRYWKDLKTTNWKWVAVLPPLPHIFCLTKQKQNQQFKNKTMVSYLHNFPEAYFYILQYNDLADFCSWHWRLMASYNLVRWAHINQTPDQSTPRL